MRKLLYFLLFICLVAMPLHAIDRDNDAETQYFNMAQSTTAFTLYFVDSTTNTDATYDLNTTSMNLICTGGLYAGTTTLLFSESHLDTIGELVSFLNAISTSTVGVQGGVVATIAQGMYEGNLSTGLASATTTYINGAAYAKALSFTGQRYGLTYRIPAPTGGNAIYLTNAVLNATYGGTFLVNVYDGTGTTTQIRQETAGATTVDKKLELPATDDFHSSVNTAMRIDIVGDGYITAGRFNLTYRLRY